MGFQHGLGVGSFEDKDIVFGTPQVLKPRIIAYWEGASATDPNNQVFAFFPQAAVNRLDFTGFDPAVYTGITHPFIIPPYDWYRGPMYLYMTTEDFFDPAQMIGLPGNTMRMVQYSWETHDIAFAFLFDPGTPLFSPSNLVMLEDLRPWQGYWIPLAAPTMGIPLSSPTTSGAKLPEVIEAYAKQQAELKKQAKVKKAA